jgi:hypothetical protein
VSEKSGVRMRGGLMHRESKREVHLETSLAAARPATRAAGLLDTRGQSNFINQKQK